MIAAAAFGTTHRYDQVHSFSITISYAIQNPTHAIGCSRIMIQAAAHPLRVTSKPDSPGGRSTGITPRSLSGGPGHWHASESDVTSFHGVSQLLGRGAKYYYEWVPIFRGSGCHAAADHHNLKCNFEAEMQHWRRAVSGRSPGPEPRLRPPAAAQPPPSRHRGGGRRHDASDQSSPPLRIRSELLVTVTVSRRRGRAARGDSERNHNLDSESSESDRRSACPAAWPDTGQPQPQGSDSDLASHCSQP